jgi:sugar phosphate permease
MALSKATQSKANWNLWRLRVFASTYLFYIGYYLCRKNYAVAQPVFMSTFHWGNTDVGTIITAYLSAYALGLFLWGAAGDRYGARKVAICGISISVLCNLFMGFASSIPVMALLWGLNGLAQGTGWPSMMKTLSAWFGLKERGRTVGWWNTCTQVGEMVAAALGSFLISKATVSGLNQAFHLDCQWQYAFWGPPVCLVLLGVMFLWAHRNRPEDVGLPSPEGKRVAKARPEPSQPKAVQGESCWTMLELMGQKHIWILGWSYFCLKLVRYAFMFWLSTYMVKSLGFAPDKAGYMSILLPLSGIVGSVFAGYASDKLFASRRAPVTALMMVGLALGVFLYSFLAADPMWGPVCLVWIGIMTFGPDSILCGTAPMDFGSQKAAASAAGFVDGMGSVGAAIQGILLGFIADRFGWHAVFLLLVSLTLLGAGLQFSMWNARPKT